MKFYFGIGVILLGLVTMSLAQQLIERAAEWRGPETVLGFGAVILGLVTCRNARKDLPAPRQDKWE